MGPATIATPRTCLCECRSSRVQEEKLKRAVLVTGHYLLSKRRAGFHFIADALWDQGWHVSFFTANFSWMSRLARDHRFAYGLPARANRAEVIDDRRTSFVWYTPWHPANRLPALLQVIGAPLFRHYSEFPLGEARPLVEQADLVIFDSTSGLALFDRFRALNPTARYVYRVSDDLRLLRAHPLVLDIEARVAPQFDLVSAASRYTYRQFRGLANARFQRHGIDKAAFDKPRPDPYSGDAQRALFVGTARLDREFMRVVPPMFPHLAFHVIGPLSGMPRLENVIAHGEMPFEETVPYVTHADVGLETIAYRPGVESLADSSLKMIQYTYCRLPIVAPGFMGSDLPSLVPYEPGSPDSMRAAVEAAAAFDRGTIQTDGIWTWSDLVGRLTGDVVDEEEN